MRFFTILSKTFAGVGIMEMGLKSEGREAPGFFWIGTTTDFFQSLGNWPVEREQLKRNERGSEREEAHCLKSNAGRSSDVRKRLDFTFLREHSISWGKMTEKDRDWGMEKERGGRIPLSVVKTEWKNCPRAFALAWSETNERPSDDLREDKEFLGLHLADIDR